MTLINVSIITPVYNVEKCIEKNIKSIINQTDKNFELLLIDDGSPDKSIQIAEELRSQGMIIENSFFDNFTEALSYAKEKKFGGILHFLESGSIEVVNVLTGQVEVKSVNELMG